MKTEDEAINILRGINIDKMIADQMLDPRDPCQIVKDGIAKMREMHGDKYADTMEGAINDVVSQIILERHCKKTPDE